MKCHKCQTELPEDSKFCLECGTSIEKKEDEGFQKNKPREATKASKAVVSEVRQDAENLDELSDEELFKCGEKYFADENYNKSQECIQLLVDKHPESGLYVAWLAHIYFELGDHERAEILSMKALETDPQIAVAHIVQGKIFLKKLDFNKALSSLDRACELGTKQASAFVIRGTVYKALKESDKALKDYDRALELNPTEPSVYIQRGNTFGELGKTDKALQDYCKALELDPKNDAAYSERGKIFEAKGDLRRALADYSHGLKANPNSSNLLDKRASLLFDLEQYRKAVSDYSTYIQLNPNEAWVYYSRGAAYTNSKQYVNALDDFRKAVSLEPSRKDELEELINFVEVRAKARERNFGVISLTIISAVFVWVMLLSVIQEMCWSVGIPVAISLYFLFHAYLKSCPSCKALLAQKENAKIASGSRTGYETVTREEKDRNGNVTRRWNEQVRVKTTSYQHHYACRICGYQWTGTSTSKSQSFYD